MTGLMRPGFCLAVWGRERAAPSGAPGRGRPLERLPAGPPGRLTRGGEEAGSEEQG